MLGKAYSNGGDRGQRNHYHGGGGGEGEVIVGRTLLSSPTVGRGCCPSVMTECLRAGFAFIMVGDCPATHYKYMTGVTWNKMLQCPF